MRGNTQSETVMAHPGGRVRKLFLYGEKILRRETELMLRNACAPGKDPDSERLAGGNLETRALGGCLPRRDGREPEQAPGVGDRRAGPACCGVHGAAESWTRPSDRTLKLIGIKAGTAEPRRRAVTLGSLTPVLPARGSGGPLSNETSCFLSTRLPSNGSFPSVGRERGRGPPLPAR